MPKMWKLAKYSSWYFILMWVLQMIARPHVIFGENVWVWDKKVLVMIMVRKLRQKIHVIYNESYRGLRGYQRWVTSFNWRMEPCVWRTERFWYVCCEFNAFLVVFCDYFVFFGFFLGCAFSFWGKGWAWRQGEKQLWAFAKSQFVFRACPGPFSTLVSIYNKL